MPCAALHAATGCSFLRAALAALAPLAALGAWLPPAQGEGASAPVQAALPRVVQSLLEAVALDTPAAPATLPQASLGFHLLFACAGARMSHSCLGAAQPVLLGKAVAWLCAVAALCPYCWASSPCCQSGDDMMTNC